MAIVSIRSSVLVQAGLALVLISGTASAQAPYQPGVGFAIVGIATGESALVSALNLGTASPRSNTSCGVTLQFLDAQGHVLKQTVVKLQPGKAASLGLSRETVPTPGSRAEIRAVLLFGYAGGAPPGPAMLQQFDCNIVPSLQIYDDHTGRTSFVLTDVKSLPPPATAAQ
jgi:hypothetical protein